MKKALFIFMIISLLSCSKDNDDTKQIAGEYLLKSLTSFHEENLIGEKPLIMIDGKAVIYDLKSRQLETGFSDSQIREILCLKREHVSKFHKGMAKDGLVFIFSKMHYNDYIYKESLFFMSHKLLTAENVKAIDLKSVKNIETMKHDAIIASSSTEDTIYIKIIELK
ncbi:MAG: hypothetical protein WBG43_03110 [Marinifilaceae bacterium]